MKTDTEFRFPVEIEDHCETRKRKDPDGQLEFDATNLPALTDLVSDVYMQMKAANRNQLAHIFGLAYLILLEEMDNQDRNQSCN